VDALSRSAELSLLAVGLTMVYSALRFANFAHVEFATVGAYLALALAGAAGLPLAAASVLAIAVVAGMGVAADMAIFSRLRAATPIMLMVASFALGIMLREGVRAIWGPAGQFYDLGVLPPLRFGEIRITPTQAVVIGTAAIAMLGFHLLLSQTRLGIAIRATADNFLLSQASGLNSEQVIRVVWFIGSGFAALGGILIGLNTQLKPDIGFGLSIEVFSAAILGGIGSPYGAILGAVIIGFAENIGLAVNWSALLRTLGFDVGQFAFIPSGFKAAIPFTLLILTLLIRPRGLLGSRR
jgi:branched-subunit amino acid ABC-type transport system permease component